MTHCFDTIRAYLTPPHPCPYLSDREASTLVVDPSEERLKQEFGSVNRTYIPLHAIVRIDEVEKEGSNKIIENSGDKGSNVAAFPMPPLQPKS